MSPFWRRRPGDDAPEPPAADDDGQRDRDDVGTPPTNPDIVFDTLARHGVDYVVIGGIAVQAHGHPRTTRDVDLIANPDHANLDRLAEALGDLDAHLMGVDADALGIEPTNPHDLYTGVNFALRTRAGRVDIWTDPAEVQGSPDNWADIRGRALEIPLTDTTTVAIVGLDDLVAMKRAAGRSVDVSDIAALTEPRNPEIERPPPGGPDVDV